MGLFDFLFKKENIQAARVNDGYFQTLTAYKPHFTSWDGYVYESALVRSAIDARARHISKLKVEIIGTANPRLQTRLKYRPNNWQTWSKFLYRTSTILDMHNTAIIVPVYDDFMMVTGYYPILPHKVEIVQVDNEPWLRYEFQNGERAAERLSECAVLTKFQYRSDFFGETNDALTPTMKLEHMNNEGIEEAIKNGATYRFMARVNNFSSTDDLKRERLRFSETNLKTEDANSGILLFPNTYTDIRQIETNAYTVPEEELKEIRNSVFNYFAVNEDILQSRAFGDAWSAFYESAIEPFAIQFSETMTAALFTETEIQRGTMLMATANRLQYLSTSEKLNVSSQMADRGVMNRDEIREIWNLPPLPDGQGQAYTIRGEYYLLNEDGTFTREGVAEQNQRSMYKPKIEFRSKSEPQTIAVDFDGCLCSNMYPKIGKANDELIARLLEEQRNGSKLILWTCRTDSLLQEALDWCRDKGIVFDGVNENSEERIKRYGSDPRKVSADLYIDDKCERVNYE